MCRLLCPSCWRHSPGCLALEGGVLVRRPRPPPQSWGFCIGDFSVRYFFLTCWRTEELRQWGVGVGVGQAVLRRWALCPRSWPGLTSCPQSQPRVTRPRSRPRCSYLGPRPVAWLGMVAAAPARPGGPGGVLPALRGLPGCGRPCPRREESGHSGCSCLSRSVSMGCGLGESAGSGCHGSLWPRP